MVDAASRRVLVVDDDETFCKRLGRALSDRNWEVVRAGSVASACAADLATFAAAVVDLKLGDGDGLEVVDAFAQRAPQAKIVVLTGYGSIATAISALRRGAFDYLTKPVDPDDIDAALRGDRRQDGIESSETPSLARVEWEHIQRVVNDCGGNISEAARRLGLHRRSLQRKLAKYPVSR